MERLFLSFAILCSACTPMRGPAPDARAADVESVDAIVNALYDVISGPAGKTRDWNRLRSLFVHDARMIPIGLKKEGGFGAHTLAVEDYVQRAGAHFDREGFFEREIARKTETFGHFAHVWSTYAAFKDSTHTEPFLRGINSLQLMNDGKRWWVVTILWEAESKENPIPSQYLPEAQP